MTRRARRSDTQVAMDSLTVLPSTPDADLHRIAGEEAAPVERLLLSTPESRAICNRPEILGIEFCLGLHKAMVRGLGAPLLREPLTRVPETRLCVLHFLRGGLSFGLREALYDVLGSTRHASAFLSSQRFQKDGIWSIREDSYRNLSIPDQAVLLCGDVVATGSTLRHGFETLIAHLHRSGTRIARLIFFTVGSKHLERALADLEAPLRELNPDYEGSTAVYLEGRFSLVERGVAPRIALPGTDLLRTDALLAPAFAASQGEAITHPLERCAIYDAGSRAFDVPLYLEDVIGYWRQVAALAEDGFTLAEALAERFDGVEHVSWSLPTGLDLDSAKALSTIAAERIETLSALGPPVGA